MENNGVEKIAVRYGATTKMVRTSVEYCGCCKDMSIHLYLKPVVFDQGLNGAKTRKVCLGCHEAGRYRGEVVHQFTFAFSPHQTAVAATA